ncbi:hypothetical protein EPA93_01810 [Ktedonosporobacter rubrisoli]|uniref:Endonuclease/exonuclease/phosphatase domain-containing protein n=1 Tax=Ktedonosporobacter rubrisoli TaxID=2509675 RepID=A0A4P6JIB3_KTERU|nr:endonuclease/exonuclease/phosphatase family protein [Ktedonosporobacter rubrisoli]QBD74795.1 hypothetical protein EPA93_01810 [Ktedonosporobacter rubrisoli]
MSLRILSYNILEGGEDRLSHIAHTIERQRPDVVALLEANSRTNAETLAQQLGMSLSFGEGNSEYYVAWLSRLPVVRTENYRRSVFSKTLLKIEVPWENTIVALFATHLSAGRKQENEQDRVAEMREILSILQQHKQQPHVLVGDMNSLCPGDEIDIATYLATATEKGEEKMRPDEFVREVVALVLQAGYTDCYRKLHPQERGYTYKLPSRPSLRLDYIFASPDLTAHLTACDIVADDEARSASDHLPIWAQFS